MNKYCVIGEKLSHTLSPLIHNSFFSKTAVNGNYSVLEISRDKLLKSKNLLLTYDGINVTIPYKKDVMSLLDVISEEASRIDAVNTIKKVNNMLYGYNSDPFGFGAMLRYNNVEVKDSICVILGGGGASKSAKYYLETNGAKKVYVVSRKKEESKLTYNDIESIDANILINATPIGMFPMTNGQIVDEKIIKNFDTVVDIVYNPLYTNLLKTAIKCDKKAVGGLYMLVAQAIQSQNIWQDKHYSESTIKEVYLLVLKDYFKSQGFNIYLTGMMGSGKSTVGQALANKLNKEYIDLDDYIVTKTGESIKTMFNKGESYFRQKEKEALCEISKKKDLVVSLGGGAILSDTNISAMRLSGLSFLLDRDISLIENSIDRDSRPLLNRNKCFSDIYEERKEKYFYANEYVIKNNGSVLEAVTKIMERL